MAKKLISIRLEEELVNILKKDAKIRRITLSDLIRMIIETYYLLIVTNKINDIQKLWDEFEEIYLNKNKNHSVLQKNI